MGNAVDIKLKEDNNVLEITESLIRDFQGRINLLDHSMTGFAKSIDTMRSSCEMIIRHVGSKETKEQESIVSGATDVLDTSQLPMRLLETIDESVSDYKFVVMESISKLCHSILEIGKSYTVPSAESLIELSVDKYRDQHKVASNGMTYYDARIEVLQNEIKYFRKSYQIARNDMEIFNEREDIYQREKNYMKKKNEELETNLRHLKSERDALSNENITKETRNEEQKKEIKDLKNISKQLDSELTAQRSERDALSNENITKETRNKEQKKEIEDLKNISKQLDSELTAQRSEQSNDAEKHEFEMDDRFREIEVLKKENNILKEQIMMKDEMKTEINTITTQKIAIQTDLEREKHAHASLIEENSSMIESLKADEMKMNRQFNELKQAFEVRTQILQQNVDDDKRANEVLQEQITTLEKEQEHAKAEQESHEQKSIKLQSNNRYLETKVADNETKIQALELELEMLKMKKVIHVQVYQQFVFDAPTAAEELLTLLKNKLALQCVDLEIIRIKNVSHMNQDIPLLITCSRTSTYVFRRDKTVSNALSGFTGKRSKRMAVVIFNRKEEAAVLKEQCSEEANALGGVFNIGCKAPFNDKTLDEIVTFINREGHIKSKVVKSTV